MTSVHVVQLVRYLDEALALDDATLRERVEKLRARAQAGWVDEILAAAEQGRPLSVGDTVEYSTDFPGAISCVRRGIVVAISPSGAVHIELPENPDVPTGSTEIVRFNADELDRLRRSTR